MILTTTEELRDENNPFGIDFHPGDKHEARPFKQLLIGELQLRQLPISGSVKENRQLLKSALEVEDKYKLLCKLTARKDFEAAFVTIEAAIPCILHGSNRLGEKIYMMLLLWAWRICYTT